MPNSERTGRDQERGRWAIINVNIGGDEAGGFTLLLITCLQVV